LAGYLDIRSRYVVVTGGYIKLNNYECTVPWVRNSRQNCIASGQPADAAAYIHVHSADGSTFVCEI